jgi:hypothetical protein
MDIKRNIVQIRDKIESMSKNYQIEMGRILLDNQININENQNGLFINLSDVNEEVMKKMQEFLEYVDLQETHLNVIETAKEGLKDTFFKEEG